MSILYDISKIVNIKKPYKYLFMTLLFPLFAA